MESSGEYGTTTHNKVFDETCDVSKWDSHAFEGEEARSSSNRVSSCACINSDRGNRLSGSRAKDAPLCNGSRGRHMGLEELELQARQADAGG